MDKNKKETGKRAALRVAYEAIMEPIKYKNNETKKKYTDAQLKKKTGLSLPTLRRIGKGELGDKSPIGYYIGVFLDLLDREYQSAVAEADTKKMNTILRTMREMLLLEHEKIYKEFD